MESRKLGLVTGNGATLWLRAGSSLRWSNGARGAGGYIWNPSLWLTSASTDRLEAITSSPWLRWSAAARVGHFRTWHVTPGHAGSTAEPGSIAVFLVMRRLLGMVMRDLSLA